MGAALGSIAFAVFIFWAVGKGSSGFAHFVDSETRKASGHRTPIRETIDEDDEDEWETKSRGTTYRAKRVRRHL